MKIYTYFILVMLYGCKSVNPSNSELIGKWQWVESGCFCPYCKCIFGLKSKYITRKHTIEIKKDSITYYSSDTILFVFKYENIVKSSVDIKFENYGDSVKKVIYDYLLLDGEISSSKDSLKIGGNTMEYIKFKRIM